MKPVYEVRQPHRHSNFDDLLRGEMRRQIAVGLVIDRLEPRRSPGIVDDGRLVGCIQAFRQWIIADVGELLFGQSGCSTEQHMGGNSVVTIVSHRCPEIGQFSLRGCHGILKINRGAELDEFAEGLRMVGHRPVYVRIDRTVARSSRSQEGIGRIGIAVGIASVNQRNTGHSTRLRQLRRPVPSVLCMGLRLHQRSSGRSASAVSIGL